MTKDFKVGDIVEIMGLRSSLWNNFHGEIVHFEGDCLVRLKPIQSRPDGLNFSTLLWPVGDLVLVKPNPQPQVEFDGDDVVVDGKRYVPAPEPGPSDAAPGTVYFNARKGKHYFRTEQGWTSQDGVKYSHDFLDAFDKEEVEVYAPVR